MAVSETSQRKRWRRLRGNLPGDALAARRVPRIDDRRQSAVPFEITPGLSGEAGPARTAVSFMGDARDQSRFLHARKQRANRIRIIRHELGEGALGEALRSATTRDGKRGHTPNVGPGTASVLDLEARKLLKVIKIGKILRQRVAAKRAFEASENVLQCLSNGEADLTFAFGDTGGAKDTANAERKKGSVIRLLFREFGMSYQNANAFNREWVPPNGPRELMPTFLSIVTKTRRFGAARAGHEREASHAFNTETIGPALGANGAVVTFRIHLTFRFMFFRCARVAQRRVPVFLGLPAAAGHRFFELPDLKQSREQVLCGSEPLKSVF